MNSGTANTRINTEIYITGWKHIFYIFLMLHITFRLQVCLEWISCVEFFDLPWCENDVVDQLHVKCHTRFLCLQSQKQLYDMLWENPLQLFSITSCFFALVIKYLSSWHTPAWTWFLKCGSRVQGWRLKGCKNLKTNFQKKTQPLTSTSNRMFPAHASTETRTIYQQALLFVIYSHCLWSVHQKVFHSKKQGLKGFKIQMSFSLRSLKPHTLKPQVLWQLNWKCIKQLFVRQFKSCDIQSFDPQVNSACETIRHDYPSRGARRGMQPSISRDSGQPSYLLLLLLFFMR